VEYLTEAEVLRRAAKATQPLRKSARRLLLEATASADEAFDVFLSHSSAEPEEILLGVKLLLEELGLRVYVDKYSDSHLSPDDVTPATAELLRHRMRNSNTLLYVHSRHSKMSRWMPWELGYFDGLKGSVGVLPLMQDPADAFQGEEYLTLYPRVDVAALKGTTKKQLWITASENFYARLDRWAKGEEEISKHSP